MTWAGSAAARPSSRPRTLYAAGSFGAFAMAPQFADRRVEIGQAFLRGAQIHPGLELSQRLVELAFAQKDDRQIDIWQRALRIESNGALEHAPRALEIAGFAVDQAAEAVDVGRGRIQPQRFVELRGGAGPVAGIPEGEAEQVMGFRGIGLAATAFSGGRPRAGEIASRQRARCRP